MHCPGSMDQPRQTGARHARSRGGRPARRVLRQHEGHRGRRPEPRRDPALLPDAHRVGRRADAPRPSPEAFQQARVLYDTAARITGPRPRTVLLPEPASRAVRHGVRAGVRAAESSSCWSCMTSIADRLGLIHRSPRRAPAPQRAARPGHALLRRQPDGDLRDTVPATRAPATKTSGAGGPAPTGSCPRSRRPSNWPGGSASSAPRCCPPTRRATPSTWPRIRAEQEREMQALGIAIRQDQWRDADWQVQALQQTKDAQPDQPALLRRPATRTA